MRFFFTLCFFLPYITQAQQRCAVDEHYFNHTHHTDNFENWLKDKRLNRLKTETADQIKTIYEIPVVFHIVHNGENLGIGTNISNERIIRQLETLNEDFLRLNADTVNTPDIFKPIAADAEIRFVFARRDPEGLPTNGIVRIQGSRTSYTYNTNRIQDKILKSESYWPAEDYLNIWIAELDGFLGWAEWPFTDMEGINEISLGRLYDGVVVDYQYVGDNLATGGRFASFGRTVTHEIGHFLGLRHVWGDGGCAVDDFCDDTPNQSVTYDGAFNNQSERDSCPPETIPSSCGTLDMYSNYMNYTADACMNIFSQCQKERMRTVLENSPRRKSLLSSPALIPPMQVANDLGIRQIISPSLEDCNMSIQPVVEVRNYGTNTINQFSVSIFVNDVFVETINRTISLAPLATALVNFNGINFTQSEPLQLSFEVMEVNETNDGNPENNLQSITLFHPGSTPPPVTIDFENTNEINSITEIQTPSLWEIANAPNQTSQNMALRYPMHQNQINQGLKDFYLTPVIDLSGINSAALFFRYSYAGNGNSFNKDGLIVGISTDCGETFREEDYRFIKFGNALSTTVPRAVFFTPAGPGDWEQIEINITPFVGNPDVRIGFAAINAGGNNLYIDDIQVVTTAINAYDIGFNFMGEIPVVTCAENQNVFFQIRNYGFEAISTFDIIVNDGTNETVLSRVLSTPLLSGNSVSQQISINDLESGINSLTIELANPNGQQNENTSNRIFSHRIVIDDYKEELPFRQDFESPSSWINTSARGKSLWEITTLNNESVLVGRGFDNEQIGTSSWFVSPIFETQEIEQGAIIFDYAYARRGNLQDRLRVLLSVNCGDDFTFTLYNANSESLTDNIVNTGYIPMDDADWQRVFIDISEYLIWPDFRLAFVFDNGNGNNLYLDNIRFLQTSNPELPEFEQRILIYPNPAEGFINIALNLMEKSAINITFSDISGKIIETFTVENALNQTLQMETPAQQGYYFITISGKGFKQTERVLIRNR